MLAQNGEKNSGYFLWKQDNNDFRFSISSFIGTSVFLLESKNGQAVLEVDGEEYRGDSASQLLADVTGQQIPVEQMKLWLLGAPTQAVENVTYDKEQQLKGFNYTLDDQQQWQLQYRARMPVANFNLPKSVNLKSASNRIKISVSEWQLYK